MTKQLIRNLLADPEIHPKCKMHGTSAWFFPSISMRFRERTLVHNEFIGEPEFHWDEILILNPTKIIGSLVFWFIVFSQVSWSRHEFLKPRNCNKTFPDLGHAHDKMMGACRSPRQKSAVKENEDGDDCCDYLVQRRFQTTCLGAERRKNKMQFLLRCIADYPEWVQIKKSHRVGVHES